MSISLIIEIAASQISLELSTLVLRYNALLSNTQHFLVIYSPGILLLSEPTVFVLPQ